MTNGELITILPRHDLHVDVKILEVCESDGQYSVLDVGGVCIEEDASGEKVLYIKAVSE